MFLPAFSKIYETILTLTWLSLEVVYIWLVSMQICLISCMLASMSIHQGLSGRGMLSFCKAMKTEAAAMICPGK